MQQEKYSGKKGKDIEVNFTISNFSIVFEKWS